MRTGTPSLSTSTSPCIWEQKEMPAISEVLTLVEFMSLFVVLHIALHHSSGSCSAPPSG